MFNIFKKNKKEDSNSPAHEDWIKAKAAFDQSEFQNALGILITGFKKDIYHKPLYELASNCLAQVGGQEESALFKKAKEKLNANTFKELGLHFFSVEHYPLTKIFLEESFNKTKDLSVAHDLAIAYARRFDTKKAQEILETVKNKFDFWTFWFYVKMKILNNDQDQLEGSILELEKSIDPHSNDKNLIVPRQKINELREAYERLKSIPNPENKIRDWHFIQYGSMILDFFYSEDQFVAGGRHVATWGSDDSIKMILSQLSLVLKQKGTQKIIYGNDRDSKIIGIALSLISDIQTEVYNPNNNYENTLLLVANSHSFNDIQKIENLENGNITFALNHSWLQANYICPDIIGLMAQSYYFQWKGGGIKMNDDGTTSHTEPDHREESIIAQQIAEAEIKEEVNIDDFYTIHLNQLKIHQAEGHRYNFMIESPVPGSFFGSN